MLGDGRSDSSQPILSRSRLTIEVSELEEWNRTESEYPRERCVHELIGEQAERRPEGEAVVYEGEVLSYGELERRGNRLGNYLREQGVGPERLVGVYLERSLEMVVGLLGVLKAGGAYVPLDPEYPPERVRYMVGDAGVELVLTEERLAGELAGLGVRVLVLEREREEIGRRSEARPESGVCPENLAYVIYTSGSTGQPKGVMVTHRSAVNYVRWAARAYGCDHGPSLVHTS